jgi:transporter family-2 protein
MIWAIAIPLFIGSLGILQGAVNKQIAQSIGLTQAVLLTNFIALALCVILFILARKTNLITLDILQVNQSFTFKWWYVFPGIMGFLIIAGVPYAIGKFGALTVTIGLVAAQMGTSVLWDIFVEKIPLNSIKVIGVFLGMLSTFLVSWKN